MPSRNHNGIKSRRMRRRLHPAGKRNSGFRGSSMMSRNATLIPQLTINIPFTKTFRFVNTSGSSLNQVPISILGLLGMAGTIATASVRVFPMWQSVRVNKVEIWGAQQSYGNDNTVAVEWDSSYVSSNNLITSDTTLSNAYPAHIVAKPPGGSLVGFWESLGGTQPTLFTTSAPANAVMDITCSFLSSNDEAAGSSAFTVTGPASVGGVYYLYADFPASHDWTPVGLVSIF